MCAINQVHASALQCSSKTSACIPLVLVCFSGCMTRVGQNRIYTPYITVYLTKRLLLKIPYIHRIYMVLANPMHGACHTGIMQS